MADVLIIGGGVAGSSCAIELRRLGIEVELAERSVFPRSKVCGCCIGPAGIAELEALGVTGALSTSVAHLDRWLGVIDSRSIELPLGRSIAVSREALDPILLERASQLGTLVHTETDAKIIRETHDRVTVELSSSSHQAATTTTHQTYQVVIIAAGLNAGSLAGRLPWIEKPNGPFGVSFMAKSDDIAAGTIHMLCDDDGYVGAVKLADGRVDVAAALRGKSRRKPSAPSQQANAKLSPPQRIDGIIKRSGMQLRIENPSPIMTTPSLRRTRVSGRGRLMAIGDAAGYVEPFTGEGMTWALHSGRAAAQFLSTNGTVSDVGDQWNRKSRWMLAEKKRACRALTSALTSPLARRTMTTTLSVFPGLAKLLMQRLERPEPLPPQPSTGARHST